ncbi:MAG: YdeI/OmpD-associated family protein [Spirosomataceae bacterium]
MNPKVDRFFITGCMRCPLGDTPNCKVHSWQEELAKLRAIALDCGLTEELKWGFPCYTFENKNLIMISVLKDCSLLSFFKGALLSDTKNLLTKPGENTQSGRVIKFTDVRQIIELESTLKDYILEMIEVEKSGQKVAFKEASDYDIPEEFQEKLNENPALKSAFYALTPGRQKGYLLHFAAPKQSQTRTSRIEKYTPWILKGKGLHD